MADNTKTRFTLSTVSKGVSEKSALYSYLSSSATSSAGPTDKSTPPSDKKSSKAATQQGGSSGTLTEVAPQESPVSVALESPDTADTYRRGGGTGDLVNPRSLLDAEKDSVALLSITNTSSEQDLITNYSRFFLQAVSEGQSEKYQVVETFSSFYTFFYGKRPPVYTFRGLLLNDENHQWLNDFMFFYENYFRGTKAAERGAEAVMTYSGRLVSGFVLDINIQQAAEIDKGVSFAMNMLVTSHTPINFSADINTLITSARAKLILEKEQIARRIASVNRQIPAGISQSVAERTNAKAPASSMTPNTVVKKAAAVSKKALSKKA